MKRFKLSRMNHYFLFFKVKSKVDPEQLKKFIMMFVSLLVMGSCASPELLYDPRINIQKPIQAILIHKYHQLRGNEAIVIKDKAIVEKVNSLLDGNDKIPKACGYHFSIFFKSNIEENTRLLYNRDCEEFSSNTKEINHIMREYFDQIDSRPTHYLYELRIKNTVEPVTVESEVQNAKTFLFFIEGPDSRLPRLEFTKTFFGRGMEEVKKEPKVFFDSEIDRLKKYYRVAKTLGPDLKHGYYAPPEVKGMYRFSVYFKMNQSFDNLDIFKNSYDDFKFVIPDSYLMVLAYPKKLTKDEFVSLKMRYDFLLDIQEYNVN